MSRKKLFKFSAIRVSDTYKVLDTRLTSLVPFVSINPCLLVLFYRVFWVCFHDGAALKFISIAGCEEMTRKARSLYLIFACGRLLICTFSPDFFFSEGKIYCLLFIINKDDNKLIRALRNCPREWIFNSKLLLKDQDGEGSSRHTVPLVEVNGDSAEFKSKPRCVAKWPMDRKEKQDCF